VADDLVSGVAGKPAADLLGRPPLGEAIEDVLAQCISSYQQLGCWTPHVEITRPAFEVALDVFQHSGSIKQRYAYDQVCAAPPSQG